MSTRLSARYRIETSADVEAVASVMASEQSSGTFVKVPGETHELRQRHAARVEQIRLMDVVNAPSLPTAGVAKGPFRQAEITISWPIQNFGLNLPTLISTLQGNLYELAQVSGLKLLDLELPTEFAKEYFGPRYGVRGTRELTGVHGRPLIGTIIKPSVGLSPSETADRVRELVEAGIDFIKDDELMANPPHSPFAERLAAVMRVIHRHAERTGKKVMYAFNITDELDAARRHYDHLLSAGGTCAMVSLNSLGMAGVKKICDQGDLPIHGHRNGWGMFTRHPMLGVEFPAYQKLWRLAGVDQIHVNGIRNKFWEADESVVQSIQSCFAPVAPGVDFSVLPVVSSGQWGGQAFDTYRLTKTVDLLYLAGGGIMAHPDGIAGGVEAIRAAWDAAVEGVSMEEAMARSSPLRRAHEMFSADAK